MTTLQASLADRVKAHWDDPAVESMYDKYLLRAEIDLIRARIPDGAKVLDAGCGEGEGTLAYASIPRVRIHAADYSRTRLKKARRRLADCLNVALLRVDFLNPIGLEHDYDAIVSQRFLINLLDPEDQQQVLRDLTGRLKPGGRLILLEGSVPGTAALNDVRAQFGLAAIPVQWHNRFLDDEDLVEWMAAHGYPLVDHASLGAYFMLTRAIRPALESGPLAWDCPFNEAAASPEMAATLGPLARFSRLKLWVFGKP